MVIINVKVYSFNFISRHFVEQDSTLTVYRPTFRLESKIIIFTTQSGSFDMTGTLKCRTTPSTGKICLLTLLNLFAIFSTVTLIRKMLDRRGEGREQPRIYRPWSRMGRTNRNVSVPQAIYKRPNQTKFTLSRRESLPRSIDSITKEITPNVRDSPTIIKTSTAVFTVRDKVLH